MTDFASQAPADVRRRSRPHKGEYYTYFTLLVLAAFAMSCAVWILSAARLARRPEEGPIRMAWRQAGTVTPMIFRA